jgi:hypothetical protein
VVSLTRLGEKCVAEEYEVRELVVVLGATAAE